MSYDNTCRGAIWPNRNKKTENHPDFTGSLNVDGVEYFLDAWKKKPDASDRAPSLSIKVKRKDVQPQAAPQQAPQQQYAPPLQPTKQSAPVSDDFDGEDIPF
jgi:hypothetical protein